MPSKKKSKKIGHNAQHAAVRSPLYRQQIVKPKRGKGSYHRKGRSWDYPQVA